MILNSGNNKRFFHQQFKLITQSYTIKYSLSLDLLRLSQKNEGLLDNSIECGYET